MSDTLCDATTSSGKSCKNRAIGEVGGRHYCRIASHKAQVEAMSQPVAPADPVAPAVEEAPAAEAPVAAEAPPEPAEPAPPSRQQILAQQECPSCGAGGQPAFPGDDFSDAPGTPLTCACCRAEWQVQ